MRLLVDESRNQLKRQPCFNAPTDQLAHHVLSKCQVGAEVGVREAQGLNYNDLLLQTRVNGEVRQSERTKDLIFDVQTVASYISQFGALEPGDVIFTGTPGSTMSMKPGDVVEIDLEGVGVLRNKVADWNRKISKSELRRSPNGPQLKSARICRTQTAGCSPNKYQPGYCRKNGSIHLENTTFAKSLKNKHFHVICGLLTIQPFLMFLASLHLRPCVAFLPWPLRAERPKSNWKLYPEEYRHMAV